MDANEKWAIAQAMIKHGGGFVSRLGAALLIADVQNAKALSVAFPRYWNQYRRIYIEQVADGDGYPNLKNEPLIIGGNDQGESEDAARFS